MKQLVSPAPAADSAAGASSMPITILLAIAVTVAGACVMVIELVGTRVLAPVFGSSLYVWTSQISVALVSLTLGYPLGGAIADRFPRPSVFFLVNVLAGIGVLVTMLIRGPILHVAMGWEARIGTLSASLAMFTLPLLLMGMVGPFAARLFVRDMQRVGFTIGKLSALSAFGSIFGSVATGFLLIPNVSITNTLYTVAGVMIGMGLIGLIAVRAIAPAVSTVAVAALLVIVNGVIASRVSAATNAALREKRMDVLYEGSSAYGDVKVVDFPRARIMFIGQMAQTVESTAGHIVTLHDIAHYLPAFRPQMHDVLLIGLAGGTKVRLLNDYYGIAVDSVEIDPLVVQKAREYFGITEGPLSRIIVEDGRPYLNTCTKQYDAVIMDVFGGGVAPSHLFSVEALEQMKRCLKPGGVLMMNCLRDADNPNDRLLADVLNTMEQSGLFKHRRTFVWRPTEGAGIHNYLTFASDEPLVFRRPLEEKVPAEVLNGPIDPRTGKPSGGLLAVAQETRVSLDNAIVIRDDLNPLDVLQISHNEGLRTNALKGFGELFDPRR